MNSFKRFSFQNFKINKSVDSRLGTEIVNEMNSRKKRSLFFQRFFMSGYYKKNVAVSCPTEFNLEQNLHTSGSVAFAMGSNFNSNVYQYSLDGNISAESFPLLPEIFFVKDCIREITHFVAAVK